MSDNALRERWIRKEFTVSEKLADFARCWRAKYAQFPSGGDTTLLGSLAWILKWLAVSVVLFVPIAVAYLTRSTAQASWLQWMAWTPLLAGGYLTVHERWIRPRVEGKNRKKTLRELNYKLARSIGRLAPMVRLYQDPESKAEKRSAVLETLDVMMQHAKVHLRAAPHEDWQVSLFVFTNNECSRMKAFERANPEFHGSGELTFDAADTALHAVASSREWRVIHDWKKLFPFAMLGDKRMRSKVLFPLVTHDQEKDAHYCIGVVTIECSRPCRFWQHESRLYDLFQPYLAYLKVMLGGLRIPIRGKESWQQCWRKDRRRTWGICNTANRPWSSG